MKAAINNCKNGVGYADDTMFQLAYQLNLPKRGSRQWKKMVADHFYKSVQFCLENPV
jgi:hypothetical protein